MAKLVRDKIPKLIKSQDKDPLFYVANSEEYYKALVEKLGEEVNEYMQSHNVEELADIMEVVYAIAKHKEVDKKKLEGIRLKKATEKGIFKNRFILKGIKE